MSNRYGTIDEPVDFEETLTNQSFPSIRRRISGISKNRAKKYCLQALSLLCSGIFLLSGSLSIVFYSHRVWHEFIEPHSFIGPFLPAYLCNELCSIERWIHLITFICFIIHIIFFKIDTEFSLCFQVTLLYLAINVFLSGFILFIALIFYRCGFTGVTCAQIATWLPEFLLKAAIWVFMIFGTVAICISVGTFILWICSDLKIQGNGDDEEGNPGRRTINV
ncbi:unnamed protein product, partial [Mesorhabditis belari]|uniref:Uncharacterized protein n=1 Tax=Mesorhabditis belari TaxID=2138241 RepID=A0AAF3F7N2_9BILA